jgi:phenylacetate-coenzyme A ligase PaaK-like adenylate-forming protein
MSSIQSRSAFARGAPGIFQKFRRNIMNTDRPYWDMEIEPLFNTPDMEKIQLGKLKKILGRLNANAPFYTRQFKERGLDPEKISNL